MTKDARIHQLKILKLEKSTLKPLASTLLHNTDRKAKLLALSMASAAILATQNAPVDFYRDMGVADASEEYNSAIMAQNAAISQIKELEALVMVESDRSHIHEKLTDLFTTIDNAHSYFENIANAKSARLFKLSAAGGTQKPDGGLVSWLAKAF